MSYEERKISAEFVAVVETRGVERDSTSRVRETGTGIVHYVYLGGEGARRELGLSGPEPRVGDMVHITFAGRRRGLSGSYDGCTTVTGGTNTHYLDLSSPNVWQPGEERRPEPEPGERIVWRRVS